MYSCLPEHVIGNYNQCMGWSADANNRLSAYLFWGAEYWLRRQRDGDPRYLGAFSRVQADECMRCCAELVFARAGLKPAAICGAQRFLFSTRLVLTGARRANQP